MFIFSISVTVNPSDPPLIPKASPVAATAGGDASSGVETEHEAEGFRAMIQKLRAKLASGTMFRAVVHGFFTVAGLTLLAKAVSFFKDAAVARRYGISDEIDAFNLAFGVFTFASSLLGNSIPAALVPAYSRLAHERAPRRADRLALQSGAIHAAALLIIAAIIYVCAGPLITLLCHGFPEPKQALARTYLRQLIPFFVCLGLTLHLGTWLRGGMKFAVAAAAPILTPIAILLVLLSSSNPSASLLVLGTDLGSMCTLLAVTISIARRLPARRAWWLASIRRWEPSVREVLVQAGPFFVSSLLIGSAPVIDQVMATPLASGSVTALSFSDKICGIILALTASAAADVLLPFFSQTVARQDWAGLRRQLIHTTRLVVGLSAPFVALLVWQAPLVVRLLFERGEFHAADTEHVASVLRFGALQIPFYIASVLMARVVVAMQANWFTLIVTAVALVNNIVFNYVLMQLYGVSGIALSTAVVYLGSCVVMYAFIFHRLRTLIRRDSQSSA